MPLRFLRHARPCRIPNRPSLTIRRTIRLRPAVSPHKSVSHSRAACPRRQREPHGAHESAPRVIGCRSHPHSLVSCATHENDRSTPSGIDTSAEQDRPCDSAGASDISARLRHEGGCRKKSSSLLTRMSSRLSAAISWSRGISEPAKTSVLSFTNSRRQRFRSPSPTSISRATSLGLVPGRVDVLPHA